MRIVTFWMLRKEKDWEQALCTSHPKGRVWSRRRAVWTWSRRRAVWNRN